MNIINYLNPEFICINLKSKNKNDIIEELTNTLRASPKVDDFNQFLEDIFDREEMMSTGIGNNIAIPHARTKAIKELTIAVGISKEGIDFNSIDKLPVNLIFLMGTPANTTGKYLQVLASLTRSLENKSFREQLLKSKSPEEIIDKFTNISKYIPETIKS